MKATKLVMTVKHLSYNKRLKKIKVTHIEKKYRCTRGDMIEVCKVLTNKLCARPHNMPLPLYAAAQLQPIHSLCLRHPVRLASSSCGHHEYS